MVLSLNVLLIFMAALLVALGATPLARIIAPRVGWVDQPSARKIHLNPVPLLGGAAIYVACAVAVLLFGDQRHIVQGIGMLAGASLMLMVGIWDDKRALSPRIKLLGEAVAALFLVISGVRIELAGYIVPQPELVVLFDSVLTMLWVIYITNAVNYLDNMDGLSGGVSAIASAFFLLLAMREGQVLVATLSAAMLGACIGFLRYNFNRASIFMGDTGALFLGFMLAAIGIKLRFANTNVVTWMIPIFVLGLPLFDITLVTLSRLLRGISPFRAGKDHTSHRLVALSWTRREAVLALYVICFVLGFLALLLAESSMTVGYTIGGLVFLGALFAFLLLERVPYNGSRHAAAVQPQARDEQGIQNQVK